MAQAAELPEKHVAMWSAAFKFREDPLGYWLWAWPWGSHGFNIVKLPKPWCDDYDCEYGPDGWVCELLEAWREAIVKRKFDRKKPSPVLPQRFCVGSGHDIGKSAFAGQVVCYIQDTRPGSKGVVTANTGAQLYSKTWPEIRKWRTSSILGKYWVIGERFVRHRAGDKYGRLDAATWKKELTEAFQGLHAANSTAYYINDEASAIHDGIFEVQEGGLLDGEPMQFLFGNRTRKAGEFSKAFGRKRSKYDYVANVDSRDCQLANKAQIRAWEEEHGEDSDFFRVRVRGMEPLKGEHELISGSSVIAAQGRKILAREYMPLVVGVDVAISDISGAESVIAPRRGWDARTIPWEIYRGLKPKALAGRCMQLARRMQSIGQPIDMFFVDGGGGYGSEVESRLEDHGYPVTLVLFNDPADEPEISFNKGAEMWVRMRDWLDANGAIPVDERLEEQLVAREHGYGKNMEIKLTPKDIMIKDGLESPDRGDGLALTFAYPVSRIDEDDEDDAAVNRAQTTFDPLRYR